MALVSKTKYAIATLGLLIAAGAIIGAISSPKSSALKLGRLKYNGGGDWYSSRTALKNLATFCNQNINTKLSTKVTSVDVGSAEIFLFPFVHMTGHGNVVFSNNDVKNLQNYLNSGGFLHIDDNYGMDEYIRKEIKKLFLNTALIEIPKVHPILFSLVPFCLKCLNYSSLILKWIRISSETILNSLCIYCSFVTLYSYLVTGLDSSDIPLLSIK